MPIVQHWWGGRVEKPSWLYINGIAQSGIPRMPLVLGRSSHKVVSLAGFRKGMQGWRPEIGKAEREHTLPQLAAWLVDLARRCSVPERAAA